MAFMASVSHTWFGNHRARNETPAYTFANSEIFSRKIKTPKELHARYLEPLIEKSAWYDEEGWVDVSWMRGVFEKFAEGRGGEEGERCKLFSYSYLIWGDFLFVGVQIWVGWCAYGADVM